MEESTSHDHAVYQDLGGITGAKRFVSIRSGLSAAGKPTIAYPRFAASGEYRTQCCFCITGSVKIQAMSITSESYRYIVRSPDVRGGNARVEGTRVGVHDVIGLLQNGESIDSLIANCFPILSRAQVYECLAYYEDHKGEIDLLVARQMAQDQT
jgi:uncharacterized protein (DUF433 family)